MRITDPGLYAIPEDDYHADPAPAPSLSASLAHTLVHRTPAHARIAHPRLNPDMEREDKRAFDIGTTAHRLFLEGIDNAVIIDAPDFRTKAAKEARDAAYAEGKTPLLAQQLEQVRAMVAAIRPQLEAHGQAADAFTKGAAEMTMIWREGETWCRARPDWSPVPTLGKGGVIEDLKTTGTSADPDIWSRTAYDHGQDLRAAFYCRGAEALFGGRWRYRFIVVETAPPYGLSVIELAPRAIELAQAKLRAALWIWADCMKHDRWPCWPPLTAYVEPPPWVEQRWQDRQLREEVAGKHGQSLADVTGLSNLDAG